jgi:methylmalonyl-CoA mutase
VTKFVDPEPRPEPVDAAHPAPVEGGGDACPPLTPIRLAAPFEPEGAAR